MITVSILGLDDGVHPFSLTPTPSEADLDADLFRDIRVDGVLDVTGTRILVAFDTSATATLQCDRTLVPFDYDARDSYSVLFAPPGRVTEGDEDDVRELPSGADSLDLTEAVRDTLMLALPVRRIAPGAEDADIQTRYGADGPDERWDALRALKDDGASDEPGS